MREKIRMLEKELKEEICKNGEFSKTAIFLKATINLYRKEIGEKPKYK